MLFLRCQPLFFTDLKFTKQDRLAGQQALGSTTSIQIWDFKYMLPDVLFFLNKQEQNHHESGLLDLCPQALCQLIYLHSFKFSGLGHAHCQFSSVICYLGDGSGTELLNHCKVQQYSDSHLTPCYMYLTSLKILNKRNDKEKPQLNHTQTNVHLLS